MGDEIKEGDMIVERNSSYLSWVTSSRHISVFSPFSLLLFALSFLYLFSFSGNQNLLLSWHYGLVLLNVISDTGKI